MMCGKADKSSVFNYEFIQSPSRARTTKECVRIYEASAVENPAPSTSTTIHIEYTVKWKIFGGFGGKLKFPCFVRGDPYQIHAESGF